MGFISKKRKISISNKGNIEREFASEIVEIFEEKLDELDVTLPGIAENNDDIEKRIKSKARNELILKIEDFVYTNKGTLSKKIA